MREDHGVADRVALITGAGRGIGAATACRLARAGWRLVLLDAGAELAIDGYEPAGPEDLERVVAECGGEELAAGVTGDVRRQGDLDRAVRVAVERFGGLDAAVAVAGAVGGGQETWRVPDELWDTMVGVNLEGVWRLARAAVPAMLDRPAPRQGRFVVVASVGGTLGLPLMSAYSAAKHGVVGLVRSLALELGPHGVTANAVAPGPTRTSALEASALVYGLDDVESFGPQQPLGRLIEPDEVAALLAWICGPDTGALNGALVPVDGGMTAA
jgi:SDR family mycofactocin-dependent oxidoreductase